MEKLHPGAKWLFRINAYIILAVITIFLLFTAIPIMVGLLITGATETPTTGFVILAVLAILYLIAVIAVGETFATMSYNRWFYEFNANGLKSEHGIIWKRYSNVPYERIQNVDIHRGIIARMFGFSTLMIQTAGFSGPYGAEGNIPAVDSKKAEELRSLVMKKITRNRK